MINLNLIDTTRDNPSSAANKTNSNFTEVKQNFDSLKTLVDANTNKTGISISQASAISTNTQKVSADGSINTHSDVQINNPQDGDSIKYNSQNNQFENVAAASAGVPGVINLGMSTGWVNMTFTDDLNIRVGAYSSTALVVVKNGKTRRFERTTDFPLWNSMSSVSCVVFQNKLLLLGRNTATSPDQWAIYMIDGVDNLDTATVSQLNTAGFIASSNNALSMSANGLGQVFINYDGGNTTNIMQIRKATLSAQGFTDVATTTLSGSSLITSPSSFTIGANDEIIVTDTGEDMAQFSSNGTLIKEVANIFLLGYNYLRTYKEDTNRYLYQTNTSAVTPEFLFGQV